MKKRLFRLIIFSVVSLFLFSQSTVDVQGASCANFSASVDGSSVTLNASGCSAGGLYKVQILQNNETVEANEVFADTKGKLSTIFHLSQAGDYQARLLFGAEEPQLITFIIDHVTPLECGDPCSPNDPDCPEECKARVTGGNVWYCLREEDPNPGEPTRGLISTSINNTEVSCTTGGNGGVQTALGCIPTEPMDLVKWLFPYLLGFGGLAAFGLIVYSGFQLMTSSGDPQKIQGAKETITSAVTGLIFIILSLFLLRLIGVDILGLPGIE
jgi:hypothetical protein